MGWYYKELVYAITTSFIVWVIQPINQGVYNMKATVTLEIEIDEHIEKLYRNFVFNYDDKKDFLINTIESLNHDNKDGYKQTVINMQIIN